MSVSSNLLVTLNPIMSKRRTSFTPTFNSGVMDVTSSSISYHWRVDEHWYTDINLVTFAGSSGAAVQVFLPTWDGVQLTINSAAISGHGLTSNAEMTKLGEAEWFDNGTAWKIITPVFLSSTSVRFNHSAGVLLSNELAAGDGLKLALRVPIYEWR